DALCTDLACWRARQGAPIDLLYSMIRWREAYRQSHAASPFFVGVSGLGASHLSARAAGVDFTVVGSAYLLTSESGLDDHARELLLSEEAHFQSLPDWRFPELHSRAWSFASDRKLCDVAEELMQCYVRGATDARVLRGLASGLAEPFRHRLEALAEELSGCADAQALRAKLRREAKALLYPGIIECDGSLSRMNAELRRQIASGISAKQLTDLLYSNQ